MKFWQLMILSLMAMVALSHAAGEDAMEKKPEGEESPEPEPEASAEPESEPDATEEPEPEAEPEHETAADPTGGVEHVNMDETKDVDKVHVGDNESEPLKEEDSDSSSESKSAAQESDENGAATITSFSTVILTTLAALKFAH